MSKNQRQIGGDDEDAASDFCCVGEVEPMPRCEQSLSLEIGTCSCSV